MKLRKSVLVGLCLASLGGISLPTTASAEVGIYLNVAPPPVRYEAVPAPRRGYLWSPGYWNASHDHHVWKPATGNMNAQATTLPSRPGPNGITVGSWNAGVGTKGIARATVFATPVTVRQTILDGAKHLTS